MKYSAAATIVIALIILGNCSLTMGIVFRHPDVVGAGALMRDSDINMDQEDDIWEDTTLENDDEIDVGERVDEVQEQKQREVNNQEEEDRRNREVHIEKFKKTLLQRLHMSAPPVQSLSNRTQGRRVLRSLPLALQGRLLKQMMSEDGVVEPPQDRTDEKETLILLKHCKYHLTD